MQQEQGPESSSEGKQELQDHLMGFNFGKKDSKGNKSFTSSLQTVTK